MSDAKIGIIIGSQSDWPTMKHAADILDELAVAHECKIVSAHRTPDRTHKLVAELENEGVQVFIIGAGAAAHLAGVVSSLTNKPVVGVPIASSDLKGVDALYATVQMPGGIPVASMAIGKAGAKNAALFAMQILATSDADLKAKLDQYRTDMQSMVAKGDEDLQGKLKDLG